MLATRSCRTPNQEDWLDSHRRISSIEVTEKSVKKKTILLSSQGYFKTTSDFLADQLVLLARESERAREPV